MKIILSIFLLSSFSTYATNKSICGINDDRQLSTDPKVARAASKFKEAGCTVTMIGRSCAISVGHCVGSLEKVSFNVPLSLNRNPRASKREDIYYRTKDFLRYKDNGAGNDWAVIKLLPNEITGQYPGDVQGHYEVDLNARLRINDIVRITGYGEDAQDSTGNFAQQTHKGAIKKLGSFFNKAKFSYAVDTKGGNSGSSVILERTNKIIGVHSHGGCHMENGYNQGTVISKNKIFKQVIQQCLNWENSL